MEVSETIGNIKKLIFSIFLTEISDYRKDLLTDKLERLDAKSFSATALNKMQGLLQKLEIGFSEKIKDEELNRLFAEFISVDTDNARDEIIDQILSFKQRFNFDRLSIICDKYGGFQIIEMLANNNSKSSIFLIDYDKKHIEFQDGFYSDQLASECLIDIDFNNTNSIWALYGQREVENQIVHVFMINKNLLDESNEELLELLVFHEVCHFLEKTELYLELCENFSEDEETIGIKLQFIANSTDQILGGWGNDVNHNATFGKILFHFLKRYDFNNRYILLGKAMIKNFLDDYSKDFLDAKKD